MENEIKIVNLKRLIIDVPAEFHAEIKAMCAKKDLSMRNWTIKVLLKALKEENNALNMEKKDA